MLSSAMLRQWIRSNQAITLLIALGVSFTVGTAAWFGLLDYPEMNLLDLGFRLRGRQPTPSNLLIIAIDDQQIATARRETPLPRELLANIVNALNHLGAKTIFLDVELPELRPPDERWEDEHLHRALLEAGNVILPAIIDDRELIKMPHRFFADVAAGVGVAHVEEALVDGRVRWDQPVRRVENTCVPSVALATWSHFVQRALPDLLDAPTPLVLSRRLEQSLDVQGRFLIDFVGPRGAIRQRSSGDLLEGKIKRDEIAGKLVLVGGMWRGADQHLGPALSAFRENPREHYFNGSEIQANAIATLLGGRVRQVGFGWIAMLLLMTALTAGTLFANCSHRTAVLASGISFFSLPAVGLWLFAAWSIFLRVTPMMCALFLNLLLILHIRAILNERRFFAEIEHLRAELPQNPRPFRSGEFVATVLFFDVRGFTRHTAAMSPSEIHEFQRVTILPMMQAVVEQGGCVDKVMGDGILAVFGVFNGDERDTTQGAWATAQAAWVMRERMRELRQERPELNDIEGIGIGLNTGMVRRDEVGGSQEFAGACLNVASRIEGVTKTVFKKYHEGGEWPVAVILLSHAAYCSIEDRVTVDDLGVTDVRDAKVHLYELRGVGGEGAIGRGARE